MNNNKPTLLFGSLLSTFRIHCLSLLVEKKREEKKKKKRKKMKEVYNLNFLNLLTLFCSSLVS